MADRRHIMREHIFKVLFDLDFHSATEIEEQIDLYFEQVPDEDDIAHPPCDLEEDEKEYVITKAKEAASYTEVIDQLINEVSVGWKTTRMPKADLTILRLAVYELRYDAQIPQRVAINEAVELAKQYGTDATPGFVNGILAKFA